MEKLLKVHSIFDTNIIIGDFNFIDNDLDKGGGMNGQDKTITQVWQNFLQELNLDDPFRKSKPKLRQYSFIGKDGKSRIDRVYINEECTQQITQHMYTHTPFTLAHKIYSFTLKGTNPKGPGYWKLNTEILNDRKFREMIQTTIDNIDEMNLTTATEWWKLFIAVSRSKAASYSTDKRQIQRRLKSHLEGKLNELEQIPITQYTETQKAQYTYYKDKYVILVNREIE